MLEQYIKNLGKYQDFNHNDNVDKFETALGDIAKLKDPECIEKLVEFFDDESDYQEVIFGIVHLIEEFDDNTYLQELLPTIPEMAKKSPYWAKVLHYRILNSPTTLKEYFALSPLLSNNIR